MKQECTNVIINTRIYKDCCDIQCGENNSVRFFCRFDGIEVTVCFAKNVIIEKKIVDG